MKIRTIGTLAALLLSLVPFGWAGVADAQTANASCTAQLAASTGTQYPPAATGLQVERNTVAAGGTVTVAGCGTPSGTVSFTLSPDPIVLGTATTNVSGFYRAALAIPCVEPGAHTLTASGAATGSTALNVNDTTGACAGAAATPATGGEDLPITGSSTTAPLTAAGIGLVLIGAATAVAARRRRAAQSA